MQVDWELSQSLMSDGHGVRGLAIGPNKDDVDAVTLYTGTQGGTCMEFGIPSACLEVWPYEHDEAVSSVCLSWSSAVENEAGSSSLFLFTGSKDSKIRIFDTKTRQLQHTLTGHEKNVTSLSCVGDYLVSGSWDGSAKVWDWKRRVLIATLSGHENSVCVSISGVVVEQNTTVLQVVTGSAGMAHPDNRIRDHTVRFWNINTQTSEVKQVYAVANDHEGPIRDVCVFEHDKSRWLATCSNDGTVKLRSLETGVATSTLFFVQQQHPPMLLSLCYTTEGCLVASAEDGTVIVWDMTNPTGMETQTISHTSCVWRVEALPNGDFCSAAEDGTVRIFTRATERMAPQSERQAFAKDAEVALAKKRGGPSPEEVAKLPRWESNFEKRGTSEGQVQLWQKNGIAIASQWSMDSQTWIEVGEVMGSAGGGGGNENEGIIDGVRYDHVLPVELENNGSIVNLKIGYNTGENPFVAAQRFIDNHMLPQYYLSQIADYIQQRTGANAGAPMIGMTDRPAPAITGVPMASYQHIPAKHYLDFELPSKSASTTMDKMRAKLVEFNKLSDDELTRVGALMEIIKATSRYHATKVPDLKILLELLNKLDTAQTFPVLDLARLTALHPDAADQNQTVWTELFLKAMELMQIPASTLGEGPAAAAIPMLTLRLFANALKGGTQSRKAVLALLDPILSRCAQPLVTSNNKNIRLSVATLLYNLACWAHMNKGALAGNTADMMSFSSLPPFMDIVSQVLSHHKLYDEPAIMRTLQALGTLVMVLPEAKQAANSLFLASKVEPAASPHSATVKAAAKEVYNVLQ